MRGWIAVLVVTVSLPGTAPAQGVQFMWSGGATHESIQVTARLDSPRSVRLAVSESPDLASPVISDPAAATVESDLVVTLSASGLKSDTQYYYAVREDDGTLQEPFGRFRTFPAPGCQMPYDLQVVVGADASVGSNALVFEAAEKRDPDLLLHLGGMTYSDIDSNDADAYGAAYQTVLTRPRQASLYRNVTSVYVWDDRDFGPDDSDSTYVGREAAKSAYVRYVPHHPLASNSLDFGVYRAFTLGRTRVIVTDARFHRSPKTDPDGPGKTMFGPAQKDWLKRELLEARDRYPLIVWINPVPWIEMPTAESDRWGGYTAERAEIAQFIADNDIYDQLLMLSADAHMVAADDGSFSGFATGATKGGFPVIHAAAFDRDGSYRGGPYRLGAAPGSMQYGVLKINDECGDRVDIEFGAFGSLDQTVLSQEDYSIGHPVGFKHSFFSGGERLVKRGSTWRYWDDGPPPSSGWASPNFIDIDWEAGPAQLGYGDAPDGGNNSDVVTELDFGFSPQLKHIAYYFRKFFDVPDVSEIKSLVANVLVDDGAVVYVNGFEVARINMPDGKIEPDTPADTTLSDESEAVFLPVDLSAATGLLFKGTNVLAVEVHQDTASSDDLSFDMELFAVTSEEAANITPVARLSASPVTGDAPLEVTFDGSESEDPDGQIISYLWDFGDGTTSGQPVVAHTFPVDGVYDVTLTVADNFGRTDIAGVQIEVTNAPPEAVIIADPLTGETPLEVSFDGSLSSDPNGEIVSFQWFFGTGDSASGENVSYIYETPGTFNPKLIVTDNLGSVDEDSVELVIAQGNLPPESVGLPDLSIPEDTGSTRLQLLDYFSDDRDLDEMLTFRITSVSNSGLFDRIGLQNDTLSLVPKPDVNGFSNFVIEVTDTEGLSTVDTLDVTIRPVNDAPTFVAGRDTVVTTDAGPVSVSGWATNISAGPDDESLQILAFELSASRQDLFSAAPEISSDGTLTFEPATDTSGLAEIAVVLRDDGGTAWGGVDSSSAVIMTIRTNHRPIASFDFVRDGFGSLTVHFDASGSHDRDGSIELFEWNFGGGAVGNGRQITHTFAEATPTDVRLSVTDNFGAKADAEASVAVSTESESLPDAFAVSEFYPNPADGIVKLELALPQAEALRITVVDVTGRVVSRHRWQGRAGYSEWEFRIGAIPAGTYFVRIGAGNEVATRKLMVIR